MNINFCKALGAIGLSIASVSSFAKYPERPITFIAQQPPGSGSDAMTRTLADCVSQKLNQPVVVQNKPGANGILAINHLKTQKPDGYTMMSIGMSQMTITPYIYKDQPYDPIEDFSGVTIFGATPLILVTTPETGVTNLTDLETLLQTSEDGINFCSPGNGSPAHLLTTALLKNLDLEGMHIPFTGEASGLAALLGDQNEIMTLVSGTARAQVKSGKLVPLALFATERSEVFPDVPTVVELLGDDQLARPGWIGLVGPAGTETEAINVLNETAESCTKNEAFIKRFASMNAQVMATPADELATQAKADSDVWRPLIESLGLVTE